MTAKRWWLAAVLTVSLASGCCKFCDRWCGSPHQAAAAPVCCYPAQPVYCTPVATTAAAVPAAPAAGWNQPAVPCVPCR